MVLRALFIIAALARPDVDRAWAERVYEDTDDGQLRHAQEFVRDHGGSASTEQLIMAHTTIGGILWQRSCPVGGGCVVRRVADTRASRKRRRRALQPARCGSRRYPIVEVIPRNKSRARQAQQHLSIALELADSLSPDAPRSDELTETIASARLWALDPQFEAFAPLTVSSSLDFYVDRKAPEGSAERKSQLEGRKSSLRRLAAQLERRQSEANRLLAAYQRIAEVSNDRLALTAMARIGEIHAVTADQLWRAPVPRAQRKRPEQYFSYCDGMDMVAEEFWRHANMAYTACLDRAVAIEAVDGPALECQAWVERANVELYPATHELFGRPTYERTKMAVYGVQLEPEPAEPIVVRRGAGPAGQ